MSGILKLKSPKGAPNAAAFRIQTSIYGLPIPLVYGTARVSGNLIHYLDPTQTPAFSQQPHNKFISVQPQQIGWNYNAAIILALCEGTIDGVANVWQDKNAPAASPAALGFSLFTGTISQAAWSYLTTNHPSQAVPYQFIAYVANPSLSIPNNVLPNYSWEIQGLLRYNPGGGLIDAEPSDIISDYLSNAQHGLGFNLALIDNHSFYASGASLANYCLALGLLVSPVEDQQRAAADFLNELAIATNSAFVWSDGLLKAYPYGDLPATGNAHTYTPNTTPLYDFTDNDYLPRSSGEDPVTVTRKPASDRYNQVFVAYENRANNYNPDVAEAKDQSAITTLSAAGSNGLRPMPQISLPMIKSATTARLVAQLKLQREQYVCNQYAWEAGWRFSLLEPMDLVTLTDAALGLNHTPVRIVSVEELANDAGLSFLAEDWPFGVASSTRYSTGSGNGFAPAIDVAPGNTTTPTIFEGPINLQAAPLEIWIAASGGANWGGCDVWVSTDNVNFVKLGSLVGKSTFGTLTASLASNAAYPPSDVTHTLSVDVTPSGGALASVSATDYGNFVSLCYVDGEFLAYQTAALTSGFHYNLTTLARGLYFSAGASHASSSLFALCDGHVFRLAYPQGKSGQTIWFKFPAFNVYGLSLQDVGSVSSISHVISRGPIVPGQIPTPFSNLNQFPTYNTSPTPDVVVVAWNWAGDPSATFDVYIAENFTNANPSPNLFQAYGNPLASTSAGIDQYAYTMTADIDPVGTLGRKANLGFYVVAKVGSTVVAQSTQNFVVYNRN